MNKKNNGVNNVLTERQKQIREEVVNLELQARYLKAQFDIVDYTLKLDAIESTYNEYLDKQRKKEEEFKKEMEKIKEQMKQNGAIVTEVPDSVPEIEAE